MKKLLQNLKRPYSGRSYIPFVDGIRFVAILPVVILHANERFLRYVYGEENLTGLNEQLNYLISRGAIGVMIFFALSGFVLALPFAKSGYTFSYKKYFTRRLERLEPPYIFWMSLFAIIFIIKSGMGIGEMAGHYFSSIFYVHNIVYAEFPVINPVAWSLEVEIQYYIIAPFLAILYFNQKDLSFRRIFLAALIILFIVLQHVFGFQYQPFRASILGQLQHFLVGLLAADLFVHSKNWVNKKAYLYDILGVVSIIIMMFTWTDDLEKALLFSTALMGFFISTLKGKIVPQILSYKWIPVIGGMCYTIYLTHLPLLELIYSLIDRIGYSTTYFSGLTISLIITLPIILLSSIIFYTVIERPFMKKDGFQQILEKIKSRISKRLVKTEQ
ncbi:MAG: acyltransferase [Roseivirga sp.]|jgi:peptidoglycan/LPS O-acetylase OafA/YrhL|uniref:acyltransferase family protein n=1 Tax=Roseivirga sp. TaxID=1964215 RepID=UPI001B2485A7|nr:acyltransferase [Roseivirga sp.]MBO6495715.1 acyltransferase [Roseivirga sp.]